MRCVPDSKLEVAAGFTHLLAALVARDNNESQYRRGQPDLDRVRLKQGIDERCEVRRLTQYAE